jgi:hypothetical protein
MASLFALTPSATVVGGTLIFYITSTEAIGSLAANHPTDSTYKFFVDASK